VAICALLQRLALQLTDLGAYPDDPDTLQAALLEAADTNDVIVTIGGASVGDADHVVPVLRDIGQVKLWKIAVRPGKPFLHGRIGRCHVFGLPGNPASALVTCLQLVRPALLQLMGAQPEPPLRFPAVCEHALAKTTDRLEFQRGIYRDRPDGSLTVSAVTGQDADRLAAFSTANCFIVLPADSRGAAAGAPVIIEPFSSYG
jgi:molybdopterin molybdotransferase